MANENTNTAVLDPPATVPASASSPAPAPAPVLVPPEAPAPTPKSWAASAWPATGSWNGKHSAAVLLIVATLVFLGWTHKVPPKGMFPITLALLTAFVIIAGRGTVGLWRGALVDERNRLSLSRLQLVLWTVVVLSGFLTAAFWNLGSGGEPLSITVPPQLWVLIGISATSLVASPLILSTKKDEPPPSTATPATEAAKSQEADNTLRALEAQGLPRESVATQGDVVVWNRPSDARIADLFQGDEIGNAGHLDLGKVQMFFFTVVLILAYTVALATSFLHPAGHIDSLPALDSGMATLLAISHGGYLANKAVPHSVPNA